jgi:hypothetical protein
VERPGPAAASKGLAKTFSGRLVIGIKLRRQANPTAVDRNEIVAVALSHIEGILTVCRTKPRTMVFTYDRRLLLFGCPDIEMPITPMIFRATGQPALPKLMQLFKYYIESNSDGQRNSIRHRCHCPRHSPRIVVEWPYPYSFGSFDAGMQIENSSTTIL